MSAVLRARAVEGGGPSLINLMFSVDVKHHVYIFT